jgi:hypothetical protein
MAGQMTWYPGTTNVVAGNANATISNGALTLGQGSGPSGSLILEGSASGAVTLAPQGTAGTPTLTFGTSSGTPAVTASAPLAITTATGNIAITGVAGEVLGGSGPAFTPTPTLGAVGVATGQLKLAGTSSGVVTVTTNGTAGTWTMTLPTSGGSSGQFLSTDGTGITSWSTPPGGGGGGSGAINQVAYYASAGTTVTGNANALLSAGQLVFGQASASMGSVVLEGGTSGALTIQTQATAGTPTWTAGTSSGTPAVTASAPLAITAATGNISVTGAAGQVLAGATPAFTATPVLGTNTSATGTLGLANGGGSGATVTVQNIGATVAYNYNLPATAGALGAIELSGGGGSTVNTWLADVATGQVLISGGVATNPAYSATLPSAVQGNITGLGTITSGVWNGTAIANANLAQMPADTLKCNNTSITANVANCTVAQSKALLTAYISVTDPAFGAKCDGTTDDTAAIQAAINSLPNDGGVVLFPVANCKITSSLTIGNGTSSAFSTKRGVILRGMANPNAFLFTTGSIYSVPVGPKLTWAGSANPMISVNGPLQGWGVQNLYLDCASLASQGIGVASAQNGDSSNLSIANCTSRGIASSSYPAGGYTGSQNVDSLHNNWTNINIAVPGIFGSIGILLTGDSGGTSDTDYNTFTNTFIRFVGGSVSYGLYLAVCDSNAFYNMSISGIGASNVGIQLDYSGNATFPSANVIFGADVVAAGASFATAGLPSSSSRPNYLYGNEEINGGVNPTSAGWYSSGPVLVSPGVSLTGQSGAITLAGLLLTGSADSTYRISTYLDITATDAGGATVTPTIAWNDGTQVQTQSIAAKSVSSLGFVQGSVIVRSKATAGVSYQTTTSGSLGSGRYSLFITAEKLQP